MFALAFRKTVQNLFSRILLHAIPLHYQSHRELLSLEQSNSFLQLGVYF